MERRHTFYWWTISLIWATVAPTRNPKLLCILSQQVAHGAQTTFAEMLNVEAISGACHISRIQYVEMLTLVRKTKLCKISIMASESDNLSTPKPKSRWFEAISFISFLLIGSSAYALEQLQSFPRALTGTWMYETGDERLDRCKTRTILANEKAISLVRECVDEGRSITRYRVTDVLVDRAFFSGKVKRYHVLTDGPNVVFDLLNNSGRSSIFLQFWVTDDYGPTRELGVFNLGM
jgi:hypothetical protein